MGKKVEKVLKPANSEKNLNASQTNTAAANLGSSTASSSRNLASANLNSNNQKSNNKSQVKSGKFTQHKPLTTILHTSNTHIHSHSLAKQKLLEMNLFKPHKK